MSRGDDVVRSLTTRTPRPRPPGERRFSVVLPAYREPRIGDSVAAVRKALGDRIGPGELEIVVVDDGSGDDTARLARDAEADQVVELPENRGKGAAVRAGVRAATGRTIAFTDADLAYAPGQLLTLLDAIEDGWDIAVGNRQHPDTDVVAEASALRSVGGRFINAATRLVLSGRHPDTQCGIKAFRSDVARLVFSRARIDGFAFDVEIYAIAEHNGFSLVDLPVEVENSPISSVRIARDAARLLRDLGRIRWWATRGVYRLGADELTAIRGTAE